MENGEGARGMTRIHTRLMEIQRVLAESDAMFWKEEDAEAAAGLEAQAIGEEEVKWSRVEIFWKGRS